MFGGVLERKDADVEIVTAQLRWPKRVKKSHLDIQLLVAGIQ